MPEAELNLTLSAPQLGSDADAQARAASRADEAVRHARALFQRTLASWASDMLALQRRGLHQPTWDTHAGSRRLRKAA